MKFVGAIIECSWPTHSCGYRRLNRNFVASSGWMRRTAMMVNGGRLLNLAAIKPHSQAPRASTMHTTVDSTSDAARSKSAATSMRAWQVDNYNGLQAMRLNYGVSLPVIRGTNKLLIEVRAASVNPLDVLMTEGYGVKVFGAMRHLSSDGGNQMSKVFPLTVGRDFSGVVRGMSPDVKQFQAGDEVMGFIQPHEQGCHAEYAIASTNCVVKKPKGLGDVDAASLPYVGQTAWSSLYFFGGVRPSTAKGRRALILGASGGVGTFAIQLLKAWGMHVTTVANGDADEMMTSLGADCTVAYTQPNWEASLWQLDQFDVILNCTTSLSSTFAMDCLKVWSNSTYVHTMPPLLRNLDALGWPLGLMNSTAEFGFDALKGLSKGRWFRWGYILPNKKALQEIASLVEAQKIRPVVEEVFTFEDTAKAYEKVRKGHARGKTVIRFDRE